MTATLKEVETQALQLSTAERDQLIHLLIASVDEPSSEADTAIAQAWDEEIARRLDALQAGRAEWIAADRVFARLRAIAADKS